MCTADFIHESLHLSAQSSAPQTLDAGTISTVQGSRGTAMNTVYKTESLPSQSLQSSREDKKHYI